MVAISPVELAASSATPVRRRSIPLARWWATDRYEVIVFLAGLIASVASFIYYFVNGHMLEYDDSISHPMIARRILDSPTPGLSQIGGVWPPLPHLLALPFIWSNWIYYNGVSGSFESMICYVIAVVFTYRIARLIGLGTPASLLAAGIMAANPNMRYMQSISMTELPLLCGIVMAVYFLLRWSQSDSVWHMIGVIGSVIFASATRYEGWALWLASFVAIAYVMLRRRWSFAKLLDYGSYYLVFAGIFIPLWAIWNKVIIQTGWLGFTQSEYADATNWVSANEPSIGHPWIAVKTYWYAIQNISGQWMLLLAVVGLLCFLIRGRLNPNTSAALVLLFPAPFFVVMLYGGQRPLHVPQISGDMYNIRFALQMMPAVALMAAVLFDEVIRLVRRIGPAPIAIAATALACLVLTPTSTITLTEPVAAQQFDNLRSSQREVGEWIEANYPGQGDVLLATTGNEALTFYSHLPLQNVIYEGTNQKDLWRNALANPGSYVDWVVMRVEPGREDKVAQSMDADPQRLADFTLIYSENNIQIWARTSTLNVEKTN